MNVTATDSFPLKWPLGWATTPANRRENANFKTTIGRARDELLRQLKLLGAKNVVISTNITTYKRGGMDIPYADQTGAKENPGVAVYYTWDNEQYSLACDKWKDIAHNMQALNKTVDAIKGIKHWGSSQIIKAAFAGFKELPAPKTRTWYEVLGVSSLASQEEIKEAYRKLAMIHHPDRGGTRDKFQEISNAYMQALK